MKNIKIVKEEFIIVLAVTKNKSFCRIVGDNR